MFRLCQSLRPTVVWRPGNLASGASSVDISPWKNCGGEGGGGVFRAQGNGTTRDEWCISSHGPGGSPRVSSIPAREGLWLGALPSGRGPVGRSLTSNGGVRLGHCGDLQPVLLTSPEGGGLSSLSMDPSVLPPSHHPLPPLLPPTETWIQKPECPGPGGSWRGH